MAANGIPRMSTGSLRAKETRACSCISDTPMLASGRVIYPPVLDGKSAMFRAAILGQNNYFRITVPKKIWFGFKGKAAGKSLLLNIADIVHEPNEVLSKPKSEILYDWT